MVMIAVGDLLIAGTMAYYLHRARSSVTRWLLTSSCYKHHLLTYDFSSKTDSLITKLLIYTVGTGALTSMVGFAALIMYLEERNTLYFLGVILVQVKVYTNSVLTSLNVRKYNARLLSYKPSDTFTLTAVGHSQSQRSEEYGRRGEEPSVPRGYILPMHHPFNPISPSLR
ncbi:hypothetical protein SERLA73DRAFT_176401 [Serpula lacrymans var. lacrymans S7.3]|uniref:DUF6534 domain-containing protein n=2 Tax=Serpula lacrymans var. lacrymans TaxID=341189 RepID=F8PMU9_SERL3|nr:uncharacterized protein SERLADRAFT_459258 [Serpula lacrymans var. lacrymans S7.9]EGO02931.1 hypothetical protein SERLA73DRAFT_176401 [Serpula lacrymans var. lacrymans S7.3]EGO28621.1 hypothetical protein SERLADRAFT_459258 [Serpula lacrymans var. lacrymans S7.9]